MPVTKIDTDAIVMGPQSGPQMSFLTTTADICFYGGAAGGGKSYALLLDPLRACGRKGFGAVIFRRTYGQITGEGGLWDTSYKIYPHSDGIPTESRLEWAFPSGVTIKFAHMQHESDCHQWDGSQIPMIGFDELQHFTEKQFWYLLSRNRTVCGIKPYMRGTCNPDPDHWMRTFMDWWIDYDTGLPIHSRSGVIRWFVRVDNEVHWAATSEELVRKYGEDSAPKSFTFIPSQITDNVSLLSLDPGYLASLKAQPWVDRQRLLYGNWNARDRAGTVFKRSWFEVCDAAPQLVDCIRYWDRAGTPEQEVKSDKASHTAGVKMGIDANGNFWVLDVERFQESPMKVKTRIKNTASQDGINVRVGIEQDPGQAGKAEAQDQVRNLAGYNAVTNTVREAKGIRAKPVSAQAEAGNIRLVRGKWNEAYLRELENFDGSDGCVADQVDATSGAFWMLTQLKRAGVW
jgi:predicted phage terminase large subunit-like protein